MIIDGLRKDVSIQTHYFRSKFRNSVFLRWCLIFVDKDVPTYSGIEIVQNFCAILFSEWWNLVPKMTLFPCLARPCLILEKKGLPNNGCKTFYAKVCKYEGTVCLHNLTVHQPTMVCQEMDNITCFSSLENGAPVAAHVTATVGWLSSGPSTPVPGPIVPGSADCICDGAYSDILSVASMTPFAPGHELKLSGK